MLRRGRRRPGRSRRGRADTGTPSSLPAKRGYFTEVFCERSRYIHPDNGQRIDAIRDGIEEHYADSALYPILLTSLLLAADAVDSTVGLQMAYLKQWASRALRPLRLLPPALTPSVRDLRCEGMRRSWSATFRGWDSPT